MVEHTEVCFTPNDSEILPLEVGNEIITDNKEKANILNIFFTDVTNFN